MSVYSNPNNRPVPSRTDLGLDGQAELPSIIPAELLSNPTVRTFQRQADGVKVDVELREWEKELWGDVLRRPRLYGIDWAPENNDHEAGGIDEGWPEDI